MRRHAHRVAGSVHLVDVVRAIRIPRPLPGERIGAHGVPTQHVVDAGGAGCSSARASTAGCQIPDLVRTRGAPLPMAPAWNRELERARALEDTVTSL